MPATDRHRQIVEGLTNAVLFFNQDLQLDYINPAGEMLFENSARRMCNLHVNEVLAGNVMLANKIQEANTSGHPFTEREVALALPNLRTVTVDCAVTPLRDSPSNKTMLVEFNPIERSMRISRDESHLMQSNAMRALIRGLAHEIKNPLGGLRGAAQLLERELPDPALHEYTNIIIGEADRLRNLVNRLLGPTTPPERKRINIHEITEHVSQLLKVEHGENIQFEHDYDPSIPDLYADRDQIIQAVLNISRNAVQAISEANGSGVLTFRTRTLRQYTISQQRHKLVCRLDITDNGPGIESELQETIFFPMVTSRADGSGLGLPIAQSLVQQHHGLIQFESKPGLTVFSVYLPIRKQ